MRHLALYLRAPLQSWGASSKFGDRGTLDAPTRSGLTGLLAAACGVDKNDEARDRDWLARAARLSFEVVGFKRGDRMTDYHTVGARYDKDDPWQKRMIPTNAKDGKPKDNATETHRAYLSDSVFGAVLSGDDALVAEMAAALENPVWGVWLGRKSCIPTEPVFAGVFESAEAAHAALADRWRRSAERAGETIGETTAAAFSVVEALPGETNETVLDVPVSFAKREFHARGIRRDQGGESEA